MSDKILEAKLYFNVSNVTFVLTDCNYKHGEIHVFD